LNKLRETEKTKKSEETRKYVDPALAEKAREDGNAKFKVSTLGPILATLYLLTCM
jgi:stress-induced-phosphoprotein 1